MKHKFEHKFHLQITDGQKVFKRIVFSFLSFAIYIPICTSTYFVYQTEYLWYILDNTLIAHKSFIIFSIRKIKLYFSFH